jgi:hypothetical protein
VSGHEPTVGISLPKVVAVAAKLSQKALRQRECQMLTAILAAVQPAACWQSSDTARREHHDRGSNDNSHVKQPPPQLRDSLSSGGTASLNLPRFTRLLTRLSLFGLEGDATPGRGGGSPRVMLRSQPSLLSFGTSYSSPSRGSISREGSRGSQAWSLPVNRAGARDTEGTEEPKGRGTEAADESSVGGSEGGPSQEVGDRQGESWTGETSLPPGYLQWVEAQRSSTMLQWQQAQLQKVRNGSWALSDDPRSEVVTMSTRIELLSSGDSRLVEADGGLPFVVCQAKEAAARDNEVAMRPSEVIVLEVGLCPGHTPNRTSHLCEYIHARICLWLIYEVLFGASSVYEVALLVFWTRGRG